MVVVGTSCFWNVCRHLNTMEVNGISIVELKVLKIVLKRSIAHGVNSFHRDYFFSGKIVNMSFCSLGLTLLSKVRNETRYQRERGKSVVVVYCSSWHNWLLKWKPNGHHLLPITPTPSLHRPIPSSPWWTLKPSGNPTSPTLTPCLAWKQSSHGRHYFHQGIRETGERLHEDGGDNTVFRC